MPFHGSRRRTLPLLPCDAPQGREFYSTGAAAAGRSARRVLRCGDWLRLVPAIFGPVVRRGEGCTGGGRVCGTPSQRRGLCPGANAVCPLRWRDASAGGDAAGRRVAAPRLSQRCPRIAASGRGFAPPRCRKRRTTSSTGFHRIRGDRNDHACRLFCLLLGGLRAISAFGGRGATGSSAGECMTDDSRGGGGRRT